MKRTILFELQKTLNAKFVDFHGWELPIHFGSIIKEHLHTRTKAGLFDVSHMGEIFVESDNPEILKKYLQKLVANNIYSLINGKAIYTQLINYNGGIVDDLLIYKISDNKYLLIVNASNIEKDFQWILNIKKDFEGISLNNASDDYSLLALQGPSSEKVLNNIFENDFSKIKKFHFINFVYKNIPIMISRTGYTGEDGFELMIENEFAEKIYSLLLTSDEVKPIGLGARDTLRTEAGLMLYGNDLNDEISPIEAGLKWSVKGKDFIGYDIIQKQIINGTEKKLIKFFLDKGSIPREGYKILSDEKNEIGFVSSGTMSPSLNVPIGMGYINTEYLKSGKPIFVKIRNNVRELHISKK